MFNRISQKTRDIQDSFQRLSPSEKLLFGVAGFAAFAIILVAIVYLYATKVDSLQVENEELREAIRSISKHKKKYLEYNAEKQVVEKSFSYGSLSLDDYVAKAGTYADIKITESNATKKKEEDGYVVSGVSIKLRKVEISKLVKFINKLESSKKQLVQITSVSINTRWNRHQELDVDMVVSTYDKPNKPSQEKKQKSSKNSA